MHNVWCDSNMYVTAVLFRNHLHSKYGSMQVYKGSCNGNQSSMEPDMGYTTSQWQTGQKNAST